MDTVFDVVVIVCSLAMPKHCIRLEDTAVSYPTVKTCQSRGEMLAIFGRKILGVSKFNGPYDVQLDCRKKAGV